MEQPIFAFTTPRHSTMDESRFASKERDYSMLKVYPDGQVVYRYYKKSDPHPEVQNRKITLSKEELQTFLALYESKKSVILSYGLTHALSAEGQRFRHTLIHADNKVFLIPDYIIDPRSRVFIERYAYYPEADALAYYEAIRDLTTWLHQLFLSHHVSFFYSEHPDGERPSVH
jgi:hypothetical protein